MVLRRELKLDLPPEVVEKGIIFAPPHQLTNLVENNIPMWICLKMAVQESKGQVILFDSRHASREFLLRADDLLLPKLLS